MLYRFMLVFFVLIIKMKRGQFETLMYGQNLNNFYFYESNGSTPATMVIDVYTKNK